MYMQLHKVHARKWEARLNGRDYILRGTKTPHTKHVVWVALRGDTQVGVASRAFKQALEYAMEDAT